jgi:hypothetical protein
MTYPDEINVAKSQKVLRKLIEGIHVGRNLFLECKSKFSLTKHINKKNCLITVSGGSRALTKFCHTWLPFLTKLNLKILSDLVRFFSSDRVEKGGKNFVIWA